jgi:hypothetical protein
MSNLEPFPDGGVAPGRRNQPMQPQRENDASVLLITGPGERFSGGRDNAKRSMNVPLGKIS